MVIILGLELEINAEQYEYVSELTDEAGIRVFIGTQNVMPFPYELGISVAPGYSTGVMLRKVNVTSEGLVIYLIIVFIYYYYYYYSKYFAVSDWLNRPANSS